MTQADKDQPVTGSPRRSRWLAHKKKRARSRLPFLETILAELLPDFFYDARLDDEGHILLDWASPSFTRAFGELQAINRRGGLQSQVETADWPTLHDWIQQLLGAGSAQCELRLRAQDTSLLWVENHARLTRSEGSPPSIRLVGVARDITQQKRSEEALRTVETNLQAIFHVNVSEQQEFLETLQHSEEKFEKLFRASPVAMWITAVLKRRLLDANDAFLRLLAYPHKEAIGKKILDLHLWVDAEEQALVHETILAGETVEPFEARWRKKDGETIDLIVSAVPILQEGELCLLGIAVDISERIRSAEEREQLLEQVKAGRERLQRLATKLITAQEEERRRISREVHDEAGQALSALTISLNLIRAELPARQKELVERVGDAIRLTQKTLEGLRFLAQDLRPPGLDTLGLNATLQGYCEEISRRTKMPIDYLGGLSAPLPETHLISLYRFLQETLTNALKHARAQHIHVKLSHDVDVITLEVSDDGAGIPEALRQDILSRRAPGGGASQGGIGLLGLQERFGLIGGTIEIESQPGKGTSFIARLPVRTAYLEKEIFP